MLIQTKEIIELPTVLQAFLQTALFSTGLFFVFRIIYGKNKMCGNLALLGGILITVGGFLKAFQLLAKAAGNEDKPSFSNSLMVFLSAGLICVAFALWRSGRRDEAMRLSHVWTLPIILVGIAWAVAGYSGFFTNSRAWFYILLGFAVPANVILLLQLLYRSLKPTPIWLAVVLFITNLIVVLIYFKNLNQDVISEGFNQSLLTFGQGSFAAASWLLFKKES